MPKTTHLLYWFKDVGKDDIGIAGGKGANLGEMTRAKFPVPPGFIVSAKAYFQFLKDHNLTTRIQHLLSTTNFDRPDSLIQVSAHIKKAIMQEEMSEELVNEIYSYYKTLGGTLKDPLVAVRSSATAEDLPTASFAGQQETYLNVKGDANLIYKIKEAWASLFEPRAIFYRHEQKFDHFRVGIAIVVQQMIESDVSGIMFTIDPVTNNKDKMVIEAVYGLGEYIVQGKVTPDHYEIEKKSMDVLKKSIATQDIMYIRENGKNVEKKVPSTTAGKEKLTHNQLLELATLGQKLEKHYYFPQDSEWAIADKKVYIVQTRAITTTHTKKITETKISLPVILTGAPASPGITSGPVKIIHTPSDMGKILPGDIMVAPQTNPDYVPAMKKAAAIITEKGGRTSHAAIVSRELGTPAVVGAENATKILKNDMVVTVNGATGEIYKGGINKSELGNTPSSSPKYTKTATKVYVNLAEPELAEKYATENVDGVGLLRAEFMMAGIGTHPKKLIHDGKKQEFINKLAQQLEVFCKAFGSRPVVYRASDFKTNEYRNLIGGKAYEPVEPNPLLGYRGAFRYIHDPEVFKLELAAIKKVRETYKNLWLMVPFVRSVQELRDVKRIITQAGLQRSPLFKLWMMVEIPTNVIMLEDFINVGIDGVSIGSNDLTMFMLGTDRDNSEVARAYDERNPAVLWAFEHTIKTAHKHGVTASICGQAPSLYPDLLEHLIRWGVTSVSVSGDVVEQVREHISSIEKSLVKKYK
jgi:pyruvate,water dikinase